MCSAGQVYSVRAVKYSTPSRRSAAKTSDNGWHSHGTVRKYAHSQSRPCRPGRESLKEHKYAGLYQEELARPRTGPGLADPEPMLQTEKRKAPEGEPESSNPAQRRLTPHAVEVAEAETQTRYHPANEAELQDQSALGPTASRSTPEDDELPEHVIAALLAKKRSDTCLHSVVRISQLAT